jgi:hypothetical protein
LVIAAESLFLGDSGRGELRFRLALRAAKFIDHPSYSEPEVFKIMQQAYDNRSAIVHGASKRKTALPGNNSAGRTAFTDVVEELLRLGLRKALSMEDGGASLRTAAYWEKLVLTGPSRE